MCGCNGGGAMRAAQAPKLANNNSAVVAAAAGLHPNAQHVLQIQLIAEERRKVEKLRREQLLNRMLKK